MTKLEKIEKDIAALDQSELAVLAGWFAEYHAKLWDDQIEQDVISGRLNGLIRAAEREISEGKLRSL